MTALSMWHLPYLPYLPLFVYVYCEAKRAKRAERSTFATLCVIFFTMEYENQGLQNRLLLCLNSIHNTVTVPLLSKFHSLKLHLYSEKKPRANVRLSNRKVSKNRKMTPLQLGTQEYVNTQKNLLAIVASQPFYKTLVYIVYV